MASFKEGGDVTNAATNITAGGYSDADAVAAGGVGILGGQGGAAAGLGGFADSSAANVNIQGGAAEGTTDNSLRKCRSDQDLILIPSCLNHN